MSSYNASLVFATVEAALAAANASERGVFAAVGEVITDGLEGPPPDGLLGQVYALAGILGVELVAMASSIGIRLWLGRRSCWVFELRTTRFGTYLTPNASFTWQIPVLLFIGALEINIWFLWAFMNDRWITGFYFEETAVWLGFVIATLVATWSLACARALDLATAGAPAAPPAPAKPPTGHDSDSDPARQRNGRWYNSPTCLNCLFPSLAVLFTVHTLIWAGLTNAAWARVVDVARGAAQAELGADAAAAEGMSDAEFAAARARAMAVVQTGLDASRDLVWYVKGAFLSCAAHDLITWILALLVSIPFLTRLHHRLYFPSPSSSFPNSISTSTPALPRSSQRDLRLAFLFALATALVLSAACLAYALLVLIRVTTYGGADRFRVQALVAGVAGVWVFAALGVPASTVALGHSVWLLRVGRAGRSNSGGRAGWWESYESEGTGGSGDRQSGGRGRDRGRYVITIERSVVDGDGVQELELGCKPAVDGAGDRSEPELA